jgi:hypothetical protein
LAAFCRFSKFSNGFQLEQPFPVPRQNVVHLQNE